MDLACYFDHHATSPLRPEAREALALAVEASWGNPSSLHRHGARAARLRDEARGTIAACCGVDVSRVVFTGGATEAIHAAAFLASRRARASGAVLMGAVEHPAVGDAVRARFGARVEPLAVSPSGRVDPDRLRDRLERGDVALVALQAANGETGVLQPVRSLLDEARNRGIVVIVDAVAWMGREDPAAFATVDYVVGSGHKLGGLPGAGWLVVPQDESGTWLGGGGQEGGRRAGTENLPGIATMAAALAAAERERPRLVDAWREGRDAFEARLAEALPGLAIPGRGEPRLAETSFLVMPHGERTRWILQLDRAGFQVSSGSACSSAFPGRSPLAEAIGLDPFAARRTLRATAGWNTTPADWAALAEAVLKVAERLREE